MNDEQQIRELIERWAAAVHASDLETVLAGHSADIVMFDVPPPFQGVRGIDAYRETWPPFFEWQASGASFEITSLEVTTGSDVAFAHALLRCGTTEELGRNPENRLRLTLGLVKEDGRWVVRHEHHSFPLADEDEATTPRSSDEVRAIHRQWFEQTAAKDLDGLMAHVAPDVVSYEHDTPLAHVGAGAVREVCRRGLEGTSGEVGWDIPDLTVLARGDIAVTWGFNHMTAQEPGGGRAESWSRGTRVFQRHQGSWQLIHQHVSWPHDPDTGQARTDLRP